MKRHTPFRPRVHTLDDRTLPAVTLTGGTLSVLGTTGADLIRVTLADTNTIRVTDSGTGEDTTFDLSQVTNILVRARGGDDIVVVGPKITLPAEVRGWAGNDTVLGGGGNNTLLGGAGDDTIEARFGNNRIDGGDGNNTLKGGAGADHIRSAPGTNVLFGGADTTFYGVKDTDTLADPGGNPSFLGDAANPLLPVSTVDQLRDWVIQNSVADWASWFGQPANPIPPEMGGVIFTAAGGDGAGAGGASGGGGGAGGGGTAPDSGGMPGTGTNTQVAGVDEADLFKTDGQYLYTTINENFVVIDARDPDNLSVVADLTLDAQTTGSVLAFYLVGDKAVVLSQTYQYDAPTDWPALLPIDPFPGGVAEMCWPAFYKTQTVVTTIDISDPADPTVAHQATLDGVLVDSRLVDGHVYTVLDNSLYLPQPLLVDGPDGSAYESEGDYRTRLDADLTDSLPGYTTVDYAAGGAEGSGSLVEGADIYLPGTTAGQQLITVASFDPAADTADPAAVTTVAGMSGTVYASANSLYVAATDYVSPWDGSLHTQIYKFALQGDAVPLDAVGTVTGTVLNQFSMDETGGYFRIATTDGWGTDAANAVYVMADTGESLDVVGSVEDIAPGERIFSVRFDGDTGYVTTFLQTDPLFTLDLSDPTNPEVVGELVIPGFSTYLQVLGDGLVLGVGRDADPETGWAEGFQLSLFDVSDPANPEWLDVFSFPYSEDSWAAGSEAEWNHHAISWSPDVGVLALPVWLDWDTSVLEVMHVGTDGFEELGQIPHDTQVTRSIRIGDVLFSLSPGDVQAHELTDPSSQLGEVALPTPPLPPPTDGGGGGPVVIFADGGEK